MTGTAATEALAERRVYRAGVIGTARVGSWYDDLHPSSPELIPSSHAGCFVAHPQTELVAGCDLDPGRLRAFGQRWGVTALYTDYREMLAKERLDVVGIATSWGHTHAEIAPVVAAAGVRGILCEKPIATSMAEADRIVRAVREGGVTFACAYYRRWRPYYRALRATLDEGVIGRVVSIAVSGMPALMHAGTHLLDVMSYLCGDPDPAWAWGTIDDVAGDPDRSAGRASPDRSGSGYIAMQNGVRFLVESGSGVPFTYVISGTGGRLVVSNDGRDAEVWRPAPSGKPAERNTSWHQREDLALPAQERSPALLALEDVIAGIETGREPACSERHAARAMELCLAFFASDRQGGHAVRFPLEDRELSVDTG